MVTKKTAPKRPEQSKSKHEIVVRVEAPQIVPRPSAEELSEPIRSKDGKRLAIPKTWVSADQIVRMVERTPAQYVYTRPAKGGGQWSYVTVAYVQRVLDYVFGFNWDFEVVEHGKEADHVWVLGKLTIRSADGKHAIVKTQFGRSDVKKLKAGGNLDYGNDLKSASSDALKKCASMLGIARDIYGKMDFKAESGMEVRETPKVASTGQTEGNKEALPAPKDGETVIVPLDEKKINCSGIQGKCYGQGEVTPAEAAYSYKIYKKTLCRECQEKSKAPWRTK